MDNITMSGAFSPTNLKDYFGGGGGDFAVSNFSASNSNPIYGNSKAVTPKSQAVNFLIKF